MACLEPHLPPHVVEALTPLVRRRGNRPISISTMVKATRYAVPDLPFSDDILADLLAREFIRAGCVIDFDRREGIKDVSIRH